MTASAHEKQRGRGTETPLVFLVRERRWGPVPLSEALEAGGFCVHTANVNLSLGRALRVSPSVADLLILPFDGPRSITLNEIAEIRNTPGWENVPILGIAPKRMTLESSTLRDAGVVGLVDARAGLDLLLSRVQDGIRMRGDRRAAGRVSCFLPLVLRQEGGESAEFGLDLSVSGIRVTTTAPLEANTDVQIEFSLPLIGQEMVRANARVVRHCEPRTSDGRWQVGLFFYPLSDEERRLIGAEVDRIARGL